MSDAMMSVDCGHVCYVHIADLTNCGFLVDNTNIVINSPHYDMLCVGFFPPLGMPAGCDTVGVAKSSIPPLISMAKIMTSFQSISESQSRS